MISDELPINKVPRGLEAPDEINTFSSSVQWIFQPSQCFVIIAILKMATTCREDGVQNTLLMVFAGDSAPHHFHFFFEKKNCLYPQFFSSVANSWNKSLSALFFLHTYWYARLNNCGLGRPLMRVFRLPQPQVRSVSAPMSLHVHEP